MSEFCLECWNKLNGTNDPAHKFVLSRDLDLCEECGCLKHVIVKIRKKRSGMTLFACTKAHKKAPNHSK